MGPRWSLLHFLTHDNQITIYSTHARMSSFVRRTKHPDFETLPPELRLMIFEECILEYEQTSPDRELELVAQAEKWIYWDETEMQYLENADQEPSTLLWWVLERITIACLNTTMIGCLSGPIFLMMAATTLYNIFLGLRFVYLISFSIVAAQPIGEKQNNRIEELPSTTIGHELLVLWIFIKAVVSLLWRGCKSLIEAIVERHDVEPNQSEVVLRALQEHPHTLYDLPIFYLSKGLRKEALKAAKYLGRRPPLRQKRSMFSECRELKDFLGCVGIPGRSCGHNLVRWVRCEEEDDE